MLRLLLLLALAVGTTEAKPRVTLRLLAPRLGVVMAQPGKSVTVLVRVAWEDPAGRESCPSFALDWVNGHSGWTPHCDPYAPDGDPIRIVWDPKPLLFWGPGEYKLVATVSSLGQKHLARQTLTVVGAPSE